MTDELHCVKPRPDLDADAVLARIAALDDYDEDRLVGWLVGRDPAFVAGVLDDMLRFRSEQPSAPTYCTHDYVHVDPITIRCRDCGVTAQLAQGAAAPATPAITDPTLPSRYPADGDR